MLTSLTSSLNQIWPLVETSWEWMKNHKKIVAGGIVVASGYAVYKKLGPTIAQMREDIRAMEEFANRLNPPAAKYATLIQRIEHNLTVGDFTLRQYASQLRSQLTTRFDVDSIRSRLKKSGQQQANSGGSTGGDKNEDQLALWDEFKTAGFARTISAIYIIALVHALVKVQVSIVSRYVLFDQQAQAARAEAEQAAGINPATSLPSPSTHPTGSAAAAAPGGPIPPPGFSLPGSQNLLSPQACEEVNRIFFSLSKHAISIGSGQLFDAVSSIVRMELAAQPVTQLVSAETVKELLTRIRSRLNTDALGLECKEGNEAKHTSPTSSSTTNAATSMGSVDDFNAFTINGTTHSTLFQPAASLYARYLLPPPSTMNSLITSPSTFPQSDPTTSSLSSFRLAEMIAETSVLLSSEAFASTLEISIKATMDELQRQLIEATFTQHAKSSEIPFANVLVSMIKLFVTFLPDVPANFSNSASSSVASPLFHILTDLPAVKELCAVIYLPPDAIVPNDGIPKSTLDQLTSNRQFGSNSINTAAAGARSPTSIKIEEIPTTTTTTTTMTTTDAASRPTQSIVSAPRVMTDERKGQPAFDRL